MIWDTGLKDPTGAMCKFTLMNGQEKSSHYDRSGAALDWTAIKAR